MIGVSFRPYDRVLDVLRSRPVEEGVRLGFGIAPKGAAGSDKRNVSAIVPH